MYISVVEGVKRASVFLFGLGFQDAAALVGVIVSVLSVLLAAAAWITSRHAARDAKRSADIAERALAVETERRAEERRDRALDEAPDWKPRPDLKFGLEGDNGPFLVGLENVGPAAAVESAILQADGQTLIGTPVQKKPIMTGNGIFVRFADSAGSAASTSDSTQLTVVITARAVHNRQRSRYELTLLPRSPIVNGVPTWAVGPHRVEPID